MEKRALLVGLTRYVWSAAYTWPLDLRGGANDVAALAAVLQDNFAFASANLRILLSEVDTPPERQATAANIRAGLEWLIAQTAPGDVALVYYSGHGAQWPDPHGDEIDGYDESIVPSDARDPHDAAPPQGDLLDDDLHDYMTRLAARTDNLTVIFDCCHSASGTRAEQATSPGFTARQADYNIPLQSGDLAPAAAAAERTEVRTTSGATARRNAFDDSNPNYVFLAACRADESAYEAPIQPQDAVWPEEQAVAGQTRGLFTYLLGRALRHGPTATYQDILTFLRDQVSLRQTVQHPQGEGPLTRQLFGGDAPPVDWLPVTRLDATGLTLDGGAARGLAVGAGVLVYPDPGALADVALGAEEPIGKATVTQVYPLSAEATFDVPLTGQAQRQVAQLAGQARALVIRPVYPLGPLRVAVQAEGVDPAAVAPIAQAIAGRPILQLRPADDPTPDAVATVSATGVRFSIRIPAADGHPLPALAPLVLPPDDAAPGDVLRDGGNVPPSTQHSALSTRYAALAEPAANRLAMLAAFRAGLARSNPGSALTGAVQLRLILPGCAAAPPGEPHLARFAQFNLVLSYPDNSKLKNVPAAPLRDQNSELDQPPLYVNLLRFAADGSISQLYPPPGSQERLAPGQQWPPAGYEDYFQVPATPPAGTAPGPVRDRLVLFASTAPLDLRGLLQPAIPSTPTRGGETPRGLALPDLPDAATAGDWTSVTLSYLIV